MKYLTTPVLIAAAVGIIIGAAYGSKIPLVPTIASKLPGSRAV